MEVLNYYSKELPTGLATKIVELTSSIPITTSVPSTIAQDYETITSVLTKALDNQKSAFQAITSVTESVSTISLMNDILQAQATVNFYSILEVAATETNEAVKASLMTKAAEASEIMLKMFNEQAYYSGNYPSLGGNIALLVVYSVFLALQIISGVFYHQWWFLSCWVCALVLEILGYIGRIWSHENIMNFNAFVMQLVCLTLAPCFMMAGIYYVIAQLTVIYGQKFSLLRPMQYSLIFIICDIISIILQAVGGGVAAGALSVFEDTDSGSHIMVAGLAYQVFTIALFQFFWYLFFWRVYKNYKEFGEDCLNPNFKHIRERKLLVPFIIAVSAAVILIFVRSIYRLVELAEGWSSKLAVDEIYFMILEGLMVSLATCILSIMSPGLAYGRRSHIYIDKSLPATFKKQYTSELETTEKDYDDDDDDFDGFANDANLNNNNNNNNENFNGINQTNSINNDDTLLDTTNETNSKKKKKFFLF